MPRDAVDRSAEDNEVGGRGGGFQVGARLVNHSVLAGVTEGRLVPVDAEDPHSAAAADGQADRAADKADADDCEGANLRGHG